MKELIQFIWYLATLALLSGGLLAKSESARKYLNYFGAASIAVMLYFHLIGRI